MAISRLDLSNFPDCSALSNFGKCGWLRVSKCMGIKCPFSKSTEENEQSLENTYRRLSTLDAETQKRISDKYYDGGMPWKEFDGEYKKG